MPKLHPNQTHAIKALRPRAQSQSQSQSLHTHRIQASVPRTRNPHSPPRHSPTRIATVWPTSAPMSCLHGRTWIRGCGYRSAFSTQAVQAAHVHTEKIPLSPVSSSISDPDPHSHSDLTPESASRPRTSPGHAGSVETETEPPVMDFRNGRVFLVIFLGAVGALEVWFWGRGVWVRYTGKGSGSWRDGYYGK